jgi:hypothetical protein
MGFLVTEKLADCLCRASGFYARLGARSASISAFERTPPFALAVRSERRHPKLAIVHAALAYAACRAMQ